MTDQLDYTDWTWQQHTAKATELAALADQFGDTLIASKATQRQADVQQITARGWLHAKLAELKRHGAEADRPTDPVSEPAPAPEAGEVDATAATRNRRSNRRS